MKKNNPIHKVLAVLLALVIVSPATLVYASTPSLGAATSFGILGSTYTNTAVGTTINGDLGYTTGPAVSPTVNGVTHSADSIYNQAGTDQGAALANLNSQACTLTFAPGAIDLATDVTHGAVGLYTPGVYCISGAASIGAGGVTLSGAGTFIFRMSGALTSVPNSAVTLVSGASACDTFWTPGAATTLGANSTFIGTNIDPAGITIGSTVTRIGRSLAFGGTVSTDKDTLTVPTCATPIVQATVATATAPQIPIVAPMAPTTTTTVATAVSLPIITPSVSTTTVVVKSLPNTGFPPESQNIPLKVLLILLVATGLSVTLTKGAKVLQK